ncbi:MAG: PAS domain-containing protein [Bacteroidota bacterium]
MNEIKNYDRAVHKFYNSQKIIGLPLVSWDIFRSYFDKICKDYNDINGLTSLAEKNEWSYSAYFDNELINKEHIIVVTDSHLNIVHATHNIYKMNGYSADEIIGKKPKMFQGKDTCLETTEYISKAVKNKVPFETVILNYRKNGSPYKCWIKGEPIFNKKGKIVNFIAYEREVA